MEIQISPRVHIPWNFKCFLIEVFSFVVVVMVMFKERNYKMLYKDPIFSSSWSSISLVQHMPLAPHPHDLANLRGYLHTENARELTL